jgi:hypothetical protein
MISYDFNTAACRQFYSPEERKLCRRMEREANGEPAPRAHVIDFNTAPPLNEITAEEIEAAARYACEASDVDHDDDEEPPIGNGHDPDPAEASSPAPWWVAAQKPVDLAVMFLKLLRPSGPWVLSAIVPDGAIETSTAKTADDIRAFVKEYDGKRNLYYSVNPTRTALTKKAAKIDIAAIEYLLADLDPKENETPEAAKGRYLAALQQLQPAPTAIVDSGNGIQVLLKLAVPIALAEPVVITNKKNEQEKVFPEKTAKQIADIENRVKLLMETLGSVAGTQNIDRILRLPGTTNLPNAKKLKAGRIACPTKLIMFNGATCALEDFPSAAAAPQANTAGSTGTSGTGSNNTGNAGAGSNATAGVSETFGDLPYVLREMIRLPAGPNEDRSAVAASVVWSLFRRNWNDDAIQTVIEAHPAGIGERYTQGGKDLRKDIERLRQKWDAQRDNPPPPLDEEDGAPADAGGAGGPPPPDNPGTSSTAATPGPGDAGGGAGKASITPANIILDRIKLDDTVDWTRPEGLLGDTADWIMLTSRRPNRPLAVASAVSVLSAVCGRWLYGPTGTALNVYIACLAKTGTGKDRPLSAPAAILAAAGLPRLHTSAKSFSVSALEQMMVDRPCCLATVDEIGANLFARMSHKHASTHEQSMRGALLELWSRDQLKGPFATTRHAVQAGGPKVPGSVSIPRPNLTLLGASTPEKFYESVTSGAVTDGFLNRFLICEAAARGKAQEVSEADGKVPQAIVEALKKLVPDLTPFGGKLAAVLGVYSLDADIDGVVRRLHWNDDNVRDRAQELEEQILVEMDNDPGTGPLLGRVFEYSVRLASLHAVSRGGAMACVTMADLSWGASWAIQSARMMADGVTNLMASSEYEARFNLVRNVIRDAGQIGRRELLRQVRSISARERNDIIDHLIGGGWIEEIKITTKGRPTIGWKWL